MGYGKLYGREVFSATVNGKEYVYTCYGQDCGSRGFRHICTWGFNNTTECRLVRDDIVAKSCYYNRTWESFRYETVLSNAIRAVAPNKEVADKLHAILIEKRNIEEHEQCERQIKAFTTMFNSLNKDNKDSLKRMVDNLPNGMITTGEQADTIQAIGTMMSIMQ